MLALYCAAPPRLDDIPVPVPLPGEALVRVMLAGVCNTDIELTRGYMGYHGVLGHEFVGVVEQSENPYLAGRRVVGEINCVCHRCRYCKMEMPHHCLDRTVLGILGRDGAFAEFLVLPEENLHLVPDNVPDESAVFTEPIAAAFRILEQVEIHAATRVTVLGDGKLAQGIVRVLALHSRAVTCVGKYPWKLALLQGLGVQTLLATDDIEAGADVVVEATGSAGGLTRAVALVRPEGTVVLKTTVAGDTALSFALPVINEVRIVGSRCGPFRPALEALALGTIDPRPLISGEFALKDAVRAIERAQAPDVMKVLVRP